jgi:pimeloyl-ACP methyl ester carboxylesterase
MTRARKCVTMLFYLVFILVSLSAVPCDDWAPAMLRLGRRLLHVCASSRRQLSGEGGGPLHLAFEEVQTPHTSAYRGEVHTAFVVHGLLGQARNWRTFAKRLAQKVSDAGGPAWRFVLVDLRHHGGSAAHHRHQPSTLDAAAVDLQALAGVVGQPRVVIGHSLGGKVALTYGALSRAEPLTVWALDSSPGEVVGDPHGVAVILDAVAALPPVLDSRSQAAEMLQGKVPDSIKAWLVSSLVPMDGSQDGVAAQGPLRFVFDLPGARQLYDDYRARCAWHLFETPPADVEVHMVRAAKSKSWDMPSSKARLAALTPHAAARLHTVHGAGHWLHVTHPEEVMQVLLPSLLRPDG